MNPADRFMTKLAYSFILTERFQKWHLIINYSLLALSMVVYLVFATSSWIIAAACLPGALIFLVSAQALSYRKAIEGGDFMEIMNDFLRSSQ